MLVLTRKHNESIQVGDNIVITVLRSKGNTVQLGIEAPREVTVLRGELVGDQRRKPATERAEATRTISIRVPRSQMSRLLPSVGGRVAANSLATQS